MLNLSLESWGMIGGLALALVLGMLVRPISLRRNRKRALESGAIWVGLANFEALDAGTDPTVRLAFAEVGSLYGSGLSGSSQRPVGGLLHITASGLRWEPRIWLGRGEARPWSLAQESVVGLEVRKQPFPAIRSYEARLRTTQGEAKFIVVDPKGLEAAVSELLAHAA